MKRRALATALALSPLGLAAAVVVAPDAVAAPLGPPTEFSSETVVVREVVTARELVVERSDRTRLRVRIPGVTVPEGSVGGVPVCGAAPARAAMQKLVPLGSKVDLEVFSRDRGTSWVPAVGDEEAGQFAADGALYASVRSRSAALEEDEGAVTGPLAAQGWLTLGVPYATALADPTEVNLHMGDALMMAEVYESDARRRGSGVYRLCHGDFRAAPAPAPVPTSWTVTATGKVTAVGGAPLRRGMTIADLVAVLGPAQLSLRSNFCSAAWPARGLQVGTAGMLRGDFLVPPPRTEADCLARPVYDISGAGRSTQLGALPAAVPLKRAQRAVRSLARMEQDDQFVRAGRRGPHGLPRPTYLAGELDRKLRLQVLHVELPKPAAGW